MIKLLHGKLISAITNLEICIIHEFYFSCSNKIIIQNLFLFSKFLLYICIILILSLVKNFCSWFSFKMFKDYTHYADSTGAYASYPPLHTPKWIMKKVPFFLFKMVIQQKEEIRVLKKTIRDMDNCNDELLATLNRYVSFLDNYPCLLAHNPCKYSINYFTSLYFHN